MLRKRYFIKEFYFLIDNLECLLKKYIFYLYMLYMNFNGIYDLLCIYYNNLY